MTRSIYLQHKHDDALRKVSMIQEWSVQGLGAMLGTLGVGDLVEQPYPRGSESIEAMIDKKTP